MTSSRTPKGQEPQRLLGCCVSTGQMTQVCVERGIKEQAGTQKSRCECGVAWGEQHQSLGGSCAALRSALAGACPFRPSLSY